MDTQIVEESFVEDINNILSSGEVSNLYKPDEFEEVCCSVNQPVIKLINLYLNIYIYLFIYIYLYL